MRTAAMVCGLVGGIIGVLIALVASPFLAGLWGPGAVAMIPLALAAGVCGIVGGALAKNHAIAAQVLMVIGAVLGFIPLHVFWIFPGILLFVGTGLRMGSKEEPLRTSPLP